MVTLPLRMLFLSSLIFLLVDEKGEEKLRGGRVSLLFNQKQTTFHTSAAIQGVLQMSLEVLDLDLGRYHMVSAVVHKSKVVWLSLSGSD